MKRAALATAVLLSALSALRADEHGRIAEAARPIDEGVPEVAVARLQKVIATLNGADLESAKEKLAEALLAAGNPTDALRALDDAAAQGDGNKILRARILAALGHYDDALALYKRIAAAPATPDRDEAAFGVAEMLRALGRNDEALAAFARVQERNRFGVAARLRTAELLLGKGEAAEAKSLLDRTQPVQGAEKRQKRVLRARSELLAGDAEKATGLLDSLLKKPEGATHETVLAALFTMADAHLKLKTPESGDDYLEDFIERHPADPDLDRVFAKLDEVYRAERKPPRNELEKWARDLTQQPRRSFARWYLAQTDWRSGRREEALRQFEALRTSGPLAPALAPSLLQYAQLKMEAGGFRDALQILGQAEQIQPDGRVRAEIAFEKARALYLSRQFKEAAQAFGEIAVPRMQDAALLNASLAWLAGGEPAQAKSAEQKLAARGEKELAGDLQLEEAIAAAKRGDKKAEVAVEEFVRQFPQHPRISEAELALAELAFHASPPKLDAAEAHLRAARAAHPSPSTSEGIDYLGLWLADARAAAGDAVIAAANAFLRDYPQSQLVPEVRMKLAETHFRRQDFASAQTQFEILAQQDPASPLSEKALFLAAQSAAAGMTQQSMDRALELLTQVVKLNGELRWAARNEQAAIERGLGRPQDAQVLYEEVLKGEAGPAEKHEALCGEADVLFEQATADPANLARAAALYQELAAETAHEPHWQNQALFKRGLCLEKEADQLGALATFYKVLEFNPTPGEPPEFFWYYKAGFDAARLLEEQQKWSSAAAVYEKLVAANGPRSDEARTRLSQLRLEHFLWQE